MMNSFKLFPSEDASGQVVTFGKNACIEPGSAVSEVELSE